MADTAQTFQWTGINKQGKRVKGNLEAADSKEAQGELRKRDIEIVTIKQKARGGFSFKKKQKVKPKDILLFTRYLSTMMSAGLPILQALDVVGHDQDNATMHSFITALKTNVEGGKTLGESFAEYPQYFGQLYISLIKTGEKSGALDKILKRLGDYLEKTEALKRKIKKAMIYPAAIITVAMIVSLILLLFVVPRFQTIFSSFGKDLPAFTRYVINLSSFLKSYWYIVVAAVVGLVFWIRYKLRTSEKFCVKKDAMMLKMPVIGPLLRKAIIARFARTLAITLDAGMPIVDAMKSMADLMGNRLYTKAVIDICHEVVSGTQVNVAMSNTKLFPNMAIQMISIGEVSGSLSEMLNKVADYFEEEVNHTVDNLSSLLEPLIMAVLGVIIGSFVIAMYLPIFKMGSLF